jgi:DNA polymerase-1
VLALQDMFLSDRFVFCFDSDTSLRAKADPTYKANRTGKEKERTPEERQAYKELHAQIRALRDGLLCGAGFRNVLHADGYEGDDVIASVVKHSMTFREDAIIVSADHDLYQLLDGTRVLLWNPTKKVAYTDGSLEEEFGVTPASWAMVKAIAGCKTDNVVGVKGVGEKTAAAYVAGRTVRKGLLAKINEEEGRFKRNLRLVKLPYPGCPKFVLSALPPNQRKFRQVLRMTGMKSLIGGR